MHGPVKKPSKVSSQNCTDPDKAPWSASNGSTTLDLPYTDRGGPSRTLHMYLHQERTKGINSCIVRIPWQ